MKHMPRTSILVILVILAVAAPAAAGGWATVRLDAEPGELVAGESWEFSFVVKQHDRTLTNDVEPVARAVHTETGEIVTAAAEHAGAVGQFEAEITFPRAGVWKWEIAPEPFGPTTMQTLTVLSPLADETIPAAGMLGRMWVVRWFNLGSSADYTVGATLPRQAVEVMVTDHGFSPSRVEISPGTEVVWINRSTFVHDVASGNPGFRDSGLLDPGAEFRQTFAAAGTFDYGCGPHPYMTGTIVVRE